MSMTKDPEDIKIKYHRPDERLINYLKEKSPFEQEKKSLDERGKESKLSDKQKKEIEKRQEEIKKKLKILANTKGNIILNEIMFPSMANIVYFFDAVPKDPELESTFNSDIAELLGVRREHPRPNNYAFMFVNLIHGMISTASEYEKNDFRIRLIHELQKMIWHKFQDLSQRTFPVGRFSAFKVVNEDINRVLAWTEMIASTIPDQYDFEEVQAPEKIPEKHVKDEEAKRKYKNQRARERWEEFDSKQHKPKRTITFD